MSHAEETDGDVADLIARSHGKRHYLIVTGDPNSHEPPRSGWRCTCGAKSDGYGMTLKEARAVYREKHSVKGAW